MVNSNIDCQSAIFKPVRKPTSKRDADDVGVGKEDEGAASLTASGQDGGDEDAVHDQHEVDQEEPAPPCVLRGQPVDEFDNDSDDHIDPRDVHGLGTQSQVRKYDARQQNGDGHEQPHH